MVPRESRPQVKVIALSVGVTGLIFAVALGALLYGMTHPVASKVSAAASPAPASPTPPLAVASLPVSQAPHANQFALVSEFRKLEQVETSALDAAEATYKVSAQTQADFKADWLAKASAEETFIARVGELVFPIEMQADAKAYIAADSEFASAMRAYGGCETLSDCQAEKSLAQAAVAKVTGAYNVLDGDLRRSLTPRP